MPAPSPAILVCSAVSTRLGQLGEALERIRGGLPAGSLALLRLGYRQQSDIAVIILDPGPAAGRDLARLAHSLAALPGLKMVDPAAGGLSVEFGVSRALASCTTVVAVTGGAAAIAELRKQLALRVEPHGAGRMGAVLPIRFSSVEDFLDAHDRELAAGFLQVPHNGQLPAVGSSLPVELFPPGDADPIRALGTVASHYRPGGTAGFELKLLLPEATRLRLAGIVQRLRSGPPPDSRRKDLRIEARLEVTFRTGAEVAREYTQNLSRGGAFVATAKPPPVGSQVRLELVLPDATRLELPAEVVRVFEARPGAAGGGGAGCGVSFKGLSAETREKLEGFIATQALKPVARVLVVDDTALFRRMLTDALVERGCEVQEAASGAEVFQRLVEELLGFELLVLDLNLPDVQGAQLVEQIRKLGGGTSQTIAVVSGSVDDRVVQARLVIAGADEVLPKSLTAPVIADRLLALHRKRPTA